DEIALLPESIFDGLRRPVAQASLTTVEERGAQASFSIHTAPWHTPSGEAVRETPAPAAPPAEAGEPAPEPHQILGVRVLTDGAHPRVQVEASGPVAHRSLLLGSPPRLVIDLAPARLDQSLIELPADQDVITRVRASQYEPNVVRVVLDLAHPTGYRVARTEDSRVIQAELDEHVAGYSLWWENDKLHLGLDATGRVPLEIRPLREPDRLVVDLIGATVARERYDRPDVQGVRAVRMSQFQPHVVRLVVELDPEAALSLPKAAARWEPGSGTERSVPAGEVQVVWLNHLEELRARTAGDWLYLAVGADEPIELQTFQLSGPPRLVFDLPGTILGRNLQPQEWTVELEGVDGGPAQQVTLRLGQFHGGKARLVVESQEPLGFQTYMLEGANRMAIAIAPPRLGGRLVVLDPGHGGLDGGAGDEALPEKTVNLEIALHLADILRERGFEVAMTRSDDTFIPLWERAALANALNADLFVSIHNNSAADPAASGTETYYLPKQPNNLLLAQAVQQELVRTLGRRNRGVKSNNFWVLRDAEVPAILVEVSFISNPEERALLADDGYRRKAAEAIARGIVQYFARLASGPAQAATQADSIELWNRVMQEPREAEQAGVVETSS
ncbi:MAG TPA: N-acetylmuramoyl-L-alanine amidase, partial [Limnochorda sp.]